MLTLQSFTYGPFQENTYVLYNEHNEAIIIDPGMYELNEFDAFFSYLSEMDLKPTLLLNTHTHIDHIFGNAAVVMKYKVPLAFHELDKPVFDHQLTARAMYNLTFVPSPAPDYYLKENELVTLGSDSLQILLCPGHSPGSVCFYHKEQQFVIGGDVLFQQVQVRLKATICHQCGRAFKPFFLAFSHGLKAQAAFTFGDQFSDLPAKKYVAAFFSKVLHQYPERDIGSSTFPIHTR